MIVRPAKPRKKSRHAVVQGEVKLWTVVDAMSHCAGHTNCAGIPQGIQLALGDGVFAVYSIARFPDNCIFAIIILLKPLKHSTRPI